MPGHREPLTSGFTEIVPVLDSQERAERIERFAEVLAKATGESRYAGCRYFPDQGRGEVYLT